MLTVKTPKIKDKTIAITFKLSLVEGEREQIAIVFILIDCMRLAKAENTQQEFGILQ